jgi:hypothetical protein
MRPSNRAELDCVAYGEKRNSYLLCFSQLGKLLDASAGQKTNRLTRMSADRKNLKHFAADKYEGRELALANRPGTAQSRAAGHETMEALSGKEVTSGINNSARGRVAAVL